MTMKSEREFREWNEEMVERYDIERYYERSHPLVRWIEKQRIDTLVRLAAPKPGDRVLEVGCGAGHVLERFNGCTRTGIDLSAGMIEKTRRRLGAGVTLVRGVAESLPAATASFDVVICTEVLEHTRAPDTVIAELMRVAAPGARVVVSIPNEGAIDRAKRILRAIPVLRTMLRSLAAEGNEWHLHHFDRAFLQRIVAGRASIRTLAGVPSNALAVRYVALLGEP
jgi:ubiquinone/menaquinone biosynthesis C-methylase UbiE